MITVFCPTCKRAHSASESLVGKWVQCKHCGAKFQIKSGAPDPLQPPPAEKMEQLVGSETGTCAFCRKPMPSDALQCSSCQNWRRDIHRLVDTYRKLALAQLFSITFGGLLAAILFITGAQHPSARKTTLFSSEFSFEKFVTTPSFAIGVVITVLVVVVWVVTQVPAARTRRRIQQATKGLWKRPWWTF